MCVFFRAQICSVLFLNHEGFFFFLLLFLFFESIRFVQHLTHCPGWLSQTWKSKAEMLPLMPDTWCRFGKDCTTGTALPSPQSQKVPEVFPFLSTLVFVSASLCHPAIQPLSVNPCVGIRLRGCWNLMRVIPLIQVILVGSDMVLSFEFV